MSTSLHIGLFTDEGALLEALREGRRRGMRVVDVISPHPIHGLDEALGIRPSRLPWVALGGGVVGAVLGLAFQYWTAAVDWPLNVGGKPLDSLPAFVPVAFELTVLIAGVATAAAFLYRSRLWPGKRVQDAYASTSDDRCALVLEQADATFRAQDFAELLSRHGAAEVRHETEGAA